MTDTFLSERLITQIITLLQNVTTANGYETNAGARVFRARRSISAAELPAINVFESKETPDDGGRKVMKMTLELSIEGHVAADRPTTGLELGKIKTDIKRALFGTGAVPDATIAPFASILYVDAQFNPRVDGSSSESVVVTAQLKYSEKCGDPYTAG